MCVEMQDLIYRSLIEVVQAPGRLANGKCLQTAKYCKSVWQVGPFFSR
jgi:hypothetical protein